MMTRGPAAALSLLLLGPVAAADERPPDSGPPLRETQRVQSTLKGPQIEVFPLTVRTAGLVVTLERHGVEPIVELLDAHGRRLAEFPADGRTGSLPSVTAGDQLREFRS